MLKRNSINVHSNTPKLATGWPYRWFWIFFSGFANSKRVFRSSWILNECNLYFKIVKYCILSEVCVINTAPHSNSPQVMYKKYKRLVYTPPQQDFVKQTSETCRTPKILRQKLNLWPSVHRCDAITTELRRTRGELGHKQCRNTFYNVKIG